MTRACHVFWKHVPPHVERGPRDVQRLQQLQVEQHGPHRRRRRLLLSSVRRLKRELGVNFLMRVPEKDGEHQQRSAELKQSVQCEFFLLKTHKRIENKQNVKLRQEQN